MTRKKCNRRKQAHRQDGSIAGKQKTTKLQKKLQNFKQQFKRGSQKEANDNKNAPVSPQQTNIKRA